MRRRAAWRTFQATLFSLPWVGVGTGTLLVGRDPGTGLQPSWLLLGATLVLAAPEIGAWLAARRRPLMVTAGPLLATLLLSGAGLLVAPGAESAAVAWGRFAKQVVQLDLMLLFVLVPAVFLAGGRPLADLVRPLLAGAVGQAGYGLWQVADFLRPGLLPAAVERVFTSNPAIFAGSDRLYLGNVLQDIPRLRGTMCEPLYLGSFLLLALPLVGIGPRPQVLRIGPGRMVGTGRDRCGQIQGHALHLQLHRL
ncbi:hypothetical protein KDM41_08140, partial [bacterium]|nr:hypothetical protein [bacterium]